MSDRLALPLAQAEARCRPESVRRTAFEATIGIHIAPETEPAHSLEENCRKGLVLYGMVPHLVEKVKPFADWLPDALSFCPEFTEANGTIG